MCFQAVSDVDEVLSVESSFCCAEAEAIKAKNKNAREIFFIKGFIIATKIVAKDKKFLFFL
jgi:hypothetical protein